MALGKKKQRPQVFVQLPARVGFGGVDVRQVLHYLRAGPLDECFKNGGFTVEMPIERSLGHIEPGRQRRRGDTAGIGLAQHVRQGLEYLCFSVGRSMMRHGLAVSCRWRVAALSVARDRKSTRLNSSH